MTTPEPWEEPKKELWEYQYDEKNEKEGYISKDFIRTLRTAAYEQGLLIGIVRGDEEQYREGYSDGHEEGYEQGKREEREIHHKMFGCEVCMKSYREVKDHARTDLLTALKAVLGEKDGDATNTYLDEEERLWARGYNSLHDTITRFIKEQEEK